MRGRARLAVVTVCAGVACAASALAADPGRWTETGRHSVPLYYYQGITSDPAGNFYFDGIHVGLYKTDPALNELKRNDDAFPPQVHLSEGYNHIGDLTWDPAEGGRLLLPVECYYPYPGAPNSGNTCGFGANGQPEPGTGSFGVADPNTLQWLYYVKLDERDIKKAMWAEVSPDGNLVWTSAGDDLLAYNTADVKAANAAPAGPKIRPVKRLVKAVPPSGVTGAAFDGERLLVAGQGAGPFQVWSIDLTTGARELEIERTIVGESEGIDIVDALGGKLHWLIQPYNEHSIPTYGVTNGTLLHFVPKAQSSPSIQPPPCCAPGGGNQPTGAPPPSTRPPGQISVKALPRSVISGRLVRYLFHATVNRSGKTSNVAGAKLRFAGRTLRTNRRGRAAVTARLWVTGRKYVFASAPGLRNGSSWVTVRRAPRGED